MGSGDALAGEGVVSGRVVEGAKDGGDEGGHITGRVIFGSGAGEVPDAGKIAADDGESL